MLFRRVGIGLADYPMLAWRWYIQLPIRSPLDERTRKGDDHPARFDARVFADDRHWTRGSYDDGHGGHCLVGALLHLSRQHRLPPGPAISLLQDAMPRPGLPLVHFNDDRCGSAAELRSVILKARRLANDHAERERAGRRGKDLAARPDRERRAATAVAKGEPEQDAPLPTERHAA